jgi:hypothetical protein
VTGVQKCALPILNIEPLEAKVWLKNHFLRQKYWKAEFIEEIFESK